MRPSCREGVSGVRLIPVGAVSDTAPLAWGSEDASSADFHEAGTGSGDGDRGLVIAPSAAHAVALSPLEVLGLGETYADGRA
jgi:hypothetical protein